MNSGKKSLKTQYKELKSAPGDFRENIMKLLDVSRMTFFSRMKDDAWTDQEKMLIAMHLCESIEVLFPETADSHV